MQRRLGWRISYSDTVEAIVGPGARGELGRLLASMEKPPDRVAVVVDAGVPGELVEPLIQGLQGAGFPVSSRVLPGGEASKSLETLVSLLEWLLGEEATRRTMLVAVGGGAVTDTAGFAASIYMRGIRWATVPTTLLGMADAAVGGKTAVNLVAKNMVGSFHQPRFIVADTEFVRSLGERDYRSGLAEIAKHSLISGPELYNWLRLNAELLLARDEATVTEAVAKSIEVKMNIVSLDPREETGERAKLNLGHTYAHALEKASGYSIPHGYAVAIGLVVEAKAAEQLVGLSPEVTGMVEELLSMLGLPTRPPRSPGCRETVQYIRLDKKRGGDRLLLPLLEGLGRVTLHELPLEEARRAIGEACEALRGNE